MRSLALSLVLAALAFPGLSPAIGQQPATKLSLKVVTDRPDAIYKVGDKVSYSVTLLKEGQPVAGAELKYTLSKDGYVTLEESKLTSGDTAATVTGTLEEPGFLRLQVSYKPADGPVVSGVGGAAFDPLDIKPSLPVPDDFDAFWSEQKRLLAAVPMNPRLTAVDSPLADVECFDAQIDCLGGKPVSGYYVRPKGAAPKSLPAELFVHGAGVRSSSLNPGEARRGRLAMDINAHGIPNGKPTAFYEALAAGELKNYRYDGRESRDTCYFRGMFLRLMRAMDFLCAQPEWDGKTLIVRGGSQGGGQALAAAGLDPRVSAFYAGVPAICDHSGNVVNRVAGWPKLVPLGADKKPDPAILQVARYFDGMNFATRTKADAILTVGFIDNVCPPTTGYATYNNITSRKQIVTGPLASHEGPPAGPKAVDAFISDHIARQKAAP